MTDPRTDLEKSIAAAVSAATGSSGHLPEPLKSAVTQIADAIEEYVAAVAPNERATAEATRRGNERDNAMGSR